MTCFTINNGDGQATTGANGIFSIPGVPTVPGNITLRIKAVVNGKIATGASSVHPVFGRVTDAGNIVVLPTLDLLTANASSDDVSMLLGNGDGSFQDQLRFWVADGPHSVAVGQFD